MEKLLASMADQFIIVGDESKLVNRFATHFPIVLELIPQAVGYVPNFLKKHFPLSRNAYRKGEKDGGYIFTENGNYLLDVWMDEWPDLSLLNSMLKQITGVVETSLFFEIADMAVIAGKNGVKLLRAK